MTRIHEGTNVFQPFILYTIVDEKVFEGFSGSIVIREIKDKRIFKVEKKEYKLVYSINGDQLLNPNTGSVEYSVKDNIVYKGPKVILPLFYIGSDRMGGSWIKSRKRCYTRVKESGILTI